ncbi:glutamine-transport ATP-binding protein ABC transporter GlnQ [Bdellovibrio bacteriovorus W]|nr:glutamine-transport ATP-binding protein ABC transporter GlnQ [Bdellovibrio bacteriovorus W]
MSIVHGSHILIKGQSGCGKTTFLHLLAGLFSPSQGSVRIGEHDLSQMGDGELCHFRRESLGVIFQKLNILDHLTVEENIFLVSKSTDVLKKVQLADRKKDRCSYLSLGEQQRVAVARVLAQAPPIVLADEPTSSLDQVNAEFVMKALKECAQGKTLIVVSHDERIEKYFDQVIDFKELNQ